MKFQDLTNIAEIHNTETEESELETLCFDCATEQFAGVAGVEVTAHYTWENNESDSPQHCTECFVLLDYDMTNDGLEYVRAEIVSALSEGNAIGLDEDSAVYQWHEKYGASIKWPDISTVLDAEDVLRAYLVAQVWTGTISWMTNDYEHGGEEYNSDGILDHYISADNLDADIVARCTEDVDAFIELVEPYLKYWELPESVNNGQMLGAAQFGHDFSLTRNGHGAGFWDRGLGDLGDWLTRCAQSFGNSSLYGSIILDPAYATPDADGGTDWDINYVLPDTLTVYLEG